MVPKTFHAGEEVTGSPEPTGARPSRSCPPDGEQKSRLDHVTPPAFAGALKKRGVAFRVPTRAALNRATGDGLRRSRFRAFAIPEAVRFPRHSRSLGAVSLPSGLPERRLMLSTIRRIRLPHVVLCGGATPNNIISQFPMFCSPDRRCSPSANISRTRGRGSDIVIGDSFIPTTAPASTPVTSIR
jgi:hypothetical protein